MQEITVEEVLGAVTSMMKEVPFPD